MVKTRAYDTAEYLDTPEMISEYLTEALETNDAVFIATAVSTVARARGMTAISEAAGVSRTELYRALGDADVSCETIRQVIGALGVQAVSIKADVA